MNKQLYRITNITDREGNQKTEFIERAKEKHPGLIGALRYSYNNFTKEYWKTFLTRFEFIWADESNKMLSTSIVEDYEYKDGKIKVTTLNSIYYLEEVKNEMVN